MHARILLFHLSFLKKLRRIKCGKVCIRLPDMIAEYICVWVVKEDRLMLCHALLSLGLRLKYLLIIDFAISH